jgi:hypothetical protein
MTPRKGRRGVPTPAEAAALLARLCTIPREIAALRRGMVAGRIRISTARETSRMLRNEALQLAAKLARVPRRSLVEQLLELLEA